MPKTDIIVNYFIMNNVLRSLNIGEIYLSQKTKFAEIENKLCDLINCNVIQTNHMHSFIQLICDIYIILIRNIKVTNAINGKIIAVASGEILKIMILVKIKQDALEDLNLDGLENVSVLSDSDDEFLTSPAYFSAIQLQNTEYKKQELIVDTNKIIDSCVHLIMLPCSVSDKKTGCFNKIKKWFQK